MKFMSLHNSPENLPIPQDDNACSHLKGMKMPEVSLEATDGKLININELKGRFIIYCYPRTGKPNEALPDGWDLIPGARGCTPQSCAFKDHFQEIKALNSEVFGLSTQSIHEQKETVQRLHLPFRLLSDSDFKFQKTLNLPTFEVDSMKLIKRLTLIINNHLIEKVFYPIFPPNKNAEQVINWLKNNIYNE